MQAMSIETNARATTTTTTSRAGARLACRANETIERTSKRTCVVRFFTRALRSHVFVCV